MLRNPKAPTSWQHQSHDRISTAPSCAPDRQEGELLLQATRQASSQVENSCVRTSVYTWEEGEKSSVYERLSSGSSSVQKHHLSSQSMPGAAQELLREQPMVLV